jgi:hypothetical protein
MPVAIAKKMDVLRVGVRSDACCSLDYTGAIASVLPCYGKHEKINEHDSGILNQHRGMIVFTGNPVEPERGEAPSLHLTHSG